MENIYLKIKCSINNFIENICKNFDTNLLKSSCFKGKSVYGPVRSDQFGYALCINTIKCKMCSYDCVYCQTNQISDLSVFRSKCISAYELFCIIKKKLELLSIQKIPVNYIVFTPQGEPTLDINLAQKIMMIRKFDIKIAVVTNASLLWNHKVQDDLLLADYVSIKIDTVDENTWYMLNRPHPRLRLELILEGIQRFSKRFRGTLATETMIVKNINDSIQEIENIGGFLNSINRKISYFNIPSRPPIYPKCMPPDKEILDKLSKIIENSIPASSVHFKSVDDEFYGAGTLKDEIIATLSAQPMREEAVKSFIRSKGERENYLNELMQDESVSRTSYNGSTFLVLSG